MTIDNLIDKAIEAYEMHSGTDLNRTLFRRVVTDIARPLLAENHKLRNFGLPALEKVEALSRKIWSPELNKAERVAAAFPTSGDTAMKYQGQDVQTRPLKRDDIKHGGQFDQNREKVIVVYNDGREVVVAKDEMEGKPPEHSSAGGNPPEHANKPDTPPGQAERPQPKA